jgi:glycosyltransferase involved in cell wall biosynthesis
MAKPVRTVRPTAGPAPGARPRKLIIQIPCFNEEDSLPVSLAALPRALPGVDRVEWLVISDGSSDDTVAVARRLGVDHVVDLKTNQGLAKAFMAGIEACLRLGADIIVNTDADNQYRADDIARLLEPILLHRAQIVVGARPITEINHFSPVKKALQRLGSWVVRAVSGTPIEDAPSGFRAFSREAAMRLNVFNDHTYTLETIIQAGRRGIAIESVPVRTNPQLRESRLIRSIPEYVRRSLVTIFRIFLIYEPLRSFSLLGALPFCLGFLLGLRWIVLFFEDPGRSHVPSLILAAVLLLMGFLLWMLGLLGDVLAANRRLLEDVQLKLRRAQYDDAPGPGGP